jgi:thiol:disulfide interchange protein DsbD
LRIALAFMPILRGLFFLFIALAASLFAEPQPVPHGTVELIPEVRSIQPGASFTVGLHFRLEPGWHIYWKNPGDSGLPPRIGWQLPNGITAGEIEWPTPKRLPVGPLLDYGYEGDVLLPVTLKAASDLPETNAVDLRGNLRVLVCRETCIPGKAALSLNLPVQKGASPKIAANQHLFEQARASMPHPAPSAWKLSAKENGSQIVLSVQGATAKGNYLFFPANPGQIENASPQLNNPLPSGTEIALHKSAQSKQVPSTLEGLLIVPEPASAAQHTAYVINAPVTANSVPGTQAAASPAQGSQSLIVVMLLALGGGLILNLMPCVFPVLSIKTLHLLESAGKNHRVVRLSAMAYTLGVLVSFWVLVAALLGLRAGGRHLGWGFQLQSPPFVAFLCCLLFILGVSLAGLFEIGQSFMSVGSGLAQRGGYSGSFFTGVLATVVATPCTAPFMGAAVGFALSQTVFACILVFTAMAFGLASPFLLLALAPQLGRLLPRPGRWMETLKQFMAFPIFATVIWLLWVFGQQTDINALTQLLIALLVISGGGWVLNRWSRSRIASALAAIAVLAATIFSVSMAASAKPEVAAARSAANPGNGLAWEPFTPEKLANYRASGKPVLIDFTAAWCLTCQVNDRVVFQSGDVQQRLKSTQIALLRADWTSYDPAITETLAQYGRSAVPLYVLYGPNQRQPVLLPDGLLRPSTLLGALDDLKL